MPYKDPKDKKEYDKKYWLKNRDRINFRNREWSKTEEGQKSIKASRLKNRDQLLKYQTERRNKPGYREYFRKYYKNWINKKLKTDTHFKLKQALSHRIWGALKGQVKSKRTMELLGCTIDELWIHMESKFTEGMTKENYGKWHVDHIMPCASFDLTDPEQQAKCFHYTNLQPLWALDNIKKGNRVQIKATMCQE